MMRLRAGKFSAFGEAPMGNSLTNAPRPSPTMRSNIVRFSGG
jgi:hypothetical protein